MVIGELVADLSQPGQIRSTLRISNLAGMGDLAATSECQIRHGDEFDPVKRSAAGTFDIWRNRQRGADFNSYTMVHLAGSRQLGIWRRVARGRCGDGA
jgi:hypothetical protein